MVDYVANIWPTPSRQLYISFASGNRYEFHRTFNQQKCAYVMMKDSTQNHYQNGVVGVGSMFDVVNWIRQLRQTYYVVTTGVSSAAYAAALYGQLAEVDEMILFSPLIEIEGTKDLLQFFKEGPIPKTTAFIGDGDATDCDRQMCERIGVKNIVTISGFSHDALARGMRDVGLFQRLFWP